MISFEVSTRSRIEFIDITAKINQIIQKNSISEGICVIFVPHTTAAITINEKADPAVVKDIIKYLNKTIPKDGDYRHIESNSDAHIKSTLIGNSQSIAIHNSNLALGTWQGIYFCEFDGPRRRKVWVETVSV
ncbi:MAG: secondary thiamine-phosphate synthase enzyme YjbQ [Candidatus Omnitrophota bacterium]